jgi:hypothetical protein
MVQERFSSANYPRVFNSESNVNDTNTETNGQETRISAIDKYKNLFKDYDDCKDIFFKYDKDTPKRKRTKAFTFDPDLGNIIVMKGMPTSIYSLPNGDTMYMFNTQGPFKGNQ